MTKRGLKTSTAFRDWTPPKPAREQPKLERLVFRAETEEEGDVACAVLTENNIPYSTTLQEATFLSTRYVCVDFFVRKKDKAPAAEAISNGLKITTRYFSMKGLAWLFVPCLFAPLALIDVPPPLEVIGHACIAVAGVGMSLYSILVATSRCLTCGEASASWKKSCGTCSRTFTRNLFARRKTWDAVYDVD